MYCWRTALSCSSSLRAVHWFALLLCINTPPHTPPLFLLVPPFTVTIVISCFLFFCLSFSHVLVLSFFLHSNSCVSPHTCCLDTTSLQPNDKIKNLPFQCVKQRQKVKTFNSNCWVVLRFFIFFLSQSWAQQRARVFHWRWIALQFLTSHKTQFVEFFTFSGKKTAV